MFSLSPFLICGSFWFSNVVFGVIFFFPFSLCFFPLPLVFRWLVPLDSSLPCYFCSPPGEACGLLRRKRKDGSLPMVFFRL